jgi:uncharacterized protein with von Willebrand factor type A (vWA) domain
MNNRVSNLEPNQRGKFLGNLLLFARLLRKLDIRISSFQIHSFAGALQFIDIASQQDFYNAARSFLLHDISKRQQFDWAFDLYWSGYLTMTLGIESHQRISALIKPATRETDSSMQNIGVPQEEPVISRFEREKDLTNRDIQVRPLFSSNEILRRKDFSDYSSEEFIQAKQTIRDMIFLNYQKRSRRKVRSIKKSRFLDFRGTIRNNINVTGELVELDWLRNKFKLRPLIILCDISGSMEKYSKIFLFFLYGMVQDRKKIETFVFGTRLTRLTLQLRRRNADQVMDNLSTHYMDWSGGTRIGEALRDFNYHWARRVRCSSSVVMIISDGWDRGDHQLLEKEIYRLKRSAHRLIWLNPLAGVENYQPLVTGIRVILPYVDDFYPFANLGNLESLAKRLSALRS